MTPREKEYRDLFIAEALEEHEAMNRALVLLEKNPADDKTLAELFRLMHNLKANARATGFTGLAELGHKLETTFGALRNGSLKFEGWVVETIYSGIDALRAAIDGLRSPDVLNIEAPKEILDNLDKLVLGGADNAATSEAVNHSGHIGTGIHPNTQIALGELVSIPIKKLDDLMNLVGELIIDRDRVTALANIMKEHWPANHSTASVDDLRGVASHLQRLSSDLQSKVMDIRLVNVGYLLGKFPRIVRDVALGEGKEVELELGGQDIQIDRNVLQMVTDSLLHLVRNAISHGIEAPDVRQRAGKKRQGNLSIKATSEKDIVVLSIEDDGGGIDPEKIRAGAVRNGFLTSDKASNLNKDELLNLLFEPGFTLSEKITEYSGRGVGLDVVKEAVDNIGGQVELQSTIGQGTTFRLHLPNSIAVKGALLFSISEEYYAVPLLHTQAVITLPIVEVHTDGSTTFATIAGKNTPLIDGAELFGSPGHQSLLSRVINGSKTQTVNILNVIVIAYNNRTYGLTVDRLLRQQDIVVKPLQGPISRSGLFGGVTLLGSGEICLVIDVPSLGRQLMLQAQ